MRNRLSAAVLAGLLSAPLPAVHAEGTPLTHDQLQQCATQVQQLRADSARLTRASFDANAQKSAYEARAQALQAEGAALAPEDVQALTDLNARRQRHNQDLLAFNAQIQQLRSAITALNAVHTEYDRNCSNRPYRRSDFNGLSPTAQQAMRAGLADVTVPYLDSPGGSR